MALFDLKDKQNYRSNVFTDMVFSSGISNLVFSHVGFCFPFEPVLLSRYVFNSALVW